MADLTFNVPGLEINMQGLAYDVQGLTSEVPGLRHGQTRPNLRPGHPSVCLSFCPIQKCRKIKIGINVSQVKSKWSDNCQFRRSKVNVTGRQKPQDIATYLPYIF